MQAESLAEVLGVQRAGLAQHRKQLQLDSAKQRLRAPERKPQLHDRIGVQRFGLLSR